MIEDRKYGLAIGTIADHLRAKTPLLADALDAIQSVVNGLYRSIVDLTDVVDGSPWAEISLQNSWVPQFDRPVRYRKDGGGNVILDGPIGGGTVPTTVAILLTTLPFGFWPSQSVVLQVLCLSSVAIPWTMGTAAIYVDTTGGVYLASASSNVFISLSSIQFSTL